MTLPVSEESRDIIRAFVQLVSRRRTCINCLLFDEEVETCTLFNQRPPARVIAEGCERHQDEPPF